MIRVVTPGAVFEDSLLERTANNYLAAIALDGARAGLAYANITTGEFVATQLPVAQLPLELGRITPAETLVAQSALRMLENAEILDPQGAAGRFTPTDGARFATLCCPRSPGSRRR